MTQKQILNYLAEELHGYVLDNYLLTRNMFCSIDVHGTCSEYHIDNLAKAIKILSKYKTIISGIDKIVLEGDIAIIKMPNYHFNPNKISIDLNMNHDYAQYIVTKIDDYMHYVVKETYNDYVNDFEDIYYIHVQYSKKLIQHPKVSYIRNHNIYLENPAILDKFGYFLSSQPNIEYLVMSMYSFEYINYPRVDIDVSININNRINFKFRHNNVDIMLESFVKPILEEFKQVIPQHLDIDILPCFNIEPILITPDVITITMSDFTTNIKNKIKPVFVTNIFKILTYLLNSLSDSIFELLNNVNIDLVGFNNTIEGLNSKVINFLSQNYNKEFAEQELYELGSHLLNEVVINFTL